MKYFNVIKIKDEPVKFNKFIGNFHLGLSATAFASMLSLLQVAELDISLIITLICFSLTLPINIVLGISTYKNDEYTVLPRVNKWSKSFFTITLFLVFVGISGLFFHFWWVSGLSFVIVSMISVVIFGYLLTDMSIVRVHKHDKKN